MADVIGLFINMTLRRDPISIKNQHLLEEYTADHLSDVNIISGSVVT